MTEADTIDLIARAAAGDGDAVDRLVRSHQALVFRWALVAAADPDDAEDIAQAVWIKAVNHLGAFRGTARFTSWLYRLTFNTVVEWGRTRQRRAVALKLWRNGDGGASVAHPTDDIDAVQLRATVRALLADLPPRQRAVFALAELEDRGTAEIAEMLGIEEATVRVTLMKSRRAIRERMLAQQPRLSEEHRS
jgi:RNA polymerase sigma-70 factor (ECF subfamily)